MGHGRHHAETGCPQGDDRQKLSNYIGTDRFFSGPDNDAILATVLLQHEYSEHGVMR